jgi:Ribonuclease G/E
MKGRVVHLDHIAGRAAAALVVDGRLDDLLIDPDDDTPLPGAIYRAVADRPVKGLGGMFVRLPQGSGFLKQTDGIAPGQRVIVQVTGPAEDGKALPVTTRLLFKGRHGIVTPGAPGINVSRRIRDLPMRDALQAMSEAAMAGADATTGLILRSAAALADPAEVAAEIADLRRLAAAVTADLAGDPELLVEGAAAHETAWRDWADPEPDAVAEGQMAAAGVLDLIAALHSPLVPMPGFGAMRIEPTRALVAVDVNTGADTSPAAGLRASIAAARDLPRQLRLRGLAGQVVIDFAPFAKRDRGTVEQVLRAAFKADTSDATLLGFTAMGLYELTRRRDRLPLARLLPPEVA